MCLGVLVFDVGRPIHIVNNNELIRKNNETRNNQINARRT